MGFEEETVASGECMKELTGDTRRTAKHRLFSPALTATISQGTRWKDEVRLSQLRKHIPLVKQVPLHTRLFTRNQQRAKGADGVIRSWEYLPGVLLFSLSPPWPTCAPRSVQICWDKIRREAKSRLRRPAAALKLFMKQGKQVWAHRLRISRQV